MSEAYLATDKVEDRQTFSAASGTVRRLLICIVLYALPANILVQPVVDPDIWWHMRTSEWIFEHRAVPTTDPFSRDGEAKPLEAYSWLFEVVVYSVYGQFGLQGILFVRIALGMSVLASIHRFVASREPRFFMATVWTAAAFLAMTQVLIERPWLFTILFCTFTLDVVLKLREGKPTQGMVWLPVCYLLWANLHIQFIDGLAILALGCVAPVIDRWLKRAEGGSCSVLSGPPDRWKIRILAATCFVATLINPYHVGLYGVVFGYATDTQIYDLIQEFQALSFRYLSNWTLPVLLALACFTLGRRGRVSSFHVLLLAGSGYLSFHSQRDLWFGVLASLAILAPARIMPGRLTGTFAVTRWKALLIAAMVVGVIVVLAWKRQLTEDELWQKVGQRYPAQAAAVVEMRGYEGPLFNDFDWGGYLIWRLRGLPVSMDGRTNVHGGQRTKEAIAIWMADPSWVNDPDLATAGVIIANVKLPLTQLLRRDQRFELVHEDPVAVVFIARRTPKP